MDFLYDSGPLEEEQKTMNIAQALKKKSRLDKQMNDLLARVLKFNKTNVMEKGTIPKVQELLDMHNTVLSQFNALKQKIAEATVPVMDLVSEQAILRKVANSIRGMDCDAAPKKDRYSDDVVQNFNVQVGPNERDQILATYQKRIDDIQDKLDDFNAKTQVV